MTDGDDATDAGTVFLGPDAADARLETLMARPGAAERVAKVRARMADADSADMWTTAVGPFHDAVGASAVLGISVDAVRARAKRGSVLALRTGSGRVVFPTWQFDDGAVLPGLGPVLRVLGGGAVSGWTVASWLRSPDVELGGRTPLACLRAGDVDLVLQVASHAAAGWGR